MKIFKYNLYQRDNQWFFMGPKNAIVIRTDEVHDDYYDGIFCWAIVNPEDQEMVEHRTAFAPSNFDFPGISKRIGFLEEQYVILPKPYSIKGLKTEYGFLNIYYSGGNFFSGVQAKKLILRKTGQELGYPIDKLTYIGWGFLYIKQELAVYGFIVNE